MINRRGILSFIGTLPFIGTIIGVKAASANPSQEALGAHNFYLKRSVQINSVRHWRQGYDGDCGGDPRVEAVAKAINIKAICNEDVNTLVQGYEVGFSDDCNIVSRRSEVMIPSWWTSINDAKRAVAAIDDMPRHEVVLPYKNPSEVFIKLVDNIKVSA